MIPMRENRQNEAVLQLAALAFGVPLLAGAIMLYMALYARGSAPYEDRARMIPISVGLLIFGVGGTVWFARWLLRRQRRAKLAERAAAGALSLRPDQRTARAVALSFALRDELGLPPAAPGDAPVELGQLSAGELSRWVFDAFRELASHRSLALDPARVRSAIDLVGRQRHARRPADGGVHLSTPLADLIPRRGRRRAWRAFGESAGGRLPPLRLMGWAAALAVILALALTYGIVVPLTQIADRSGVSAGEDAVGRIIARIVVRGGFFVILIGAIIGFGLLFRWWFITFPSGCRTVGHLSIWLAGPPGSPPFAEFNWTPESVWTEVRRIVARSFEVPEDHVQPSTKLFALDPAGGAARIR
jgi:hypothetical protein